MSEDVYDVGSEQDTNFLTLSKGIAASQYENDPKPPARKVLNPVLI